MSLPSTSDATRAGLPRLTLVLGGARSGKSQYAEDQVRSAGLPALYIATAEARDPEMQVRIDAHKARRDPGWTTIEAPLELVNALLAAAERGQPILVDCLTLWLANLMEAGRDIGFEIERLRATLPRLKPPVVTVANEVGLGIVPENELARRFRDHAGRLNQAVAALANRVVFIAAGLPLVLKAVPPHRQPGQPLSAVGPEGFDREERSNGLSPLPAGEREGPAQRVGG